MEQHNTDILVIGAGLTGLTTAFRLTRGGKQVHIQILGAAGIPQTQCIHLGIIVSGDEHIPWHSQYRLVPHMLRRIFPV